MMFWNASIRRAARAPDYYVLRLGKDVPSFPSAPFLARGIRCAPDLLMTKLNTCPTIRESASLRSDDVHPPARNGVQLRRSPHLGGHLGLRYSKARKPARTVQQGARRAANDACQAHRIVRATH